MSSHYRIGKHSSLMGPRGSLLMPGTRIDKEETLTRLGAKEVDRLRGMGVLVDADQQYESPENPNITGQIPLPHEVNTQEEAPMTTTAREPRQPPPTDPAQTPAKYEAWTIDPVTLTGKDVAELNVMIAERTFPSNVTQSFETPEEAIAWLSQDFVAADAPAVATAT